MEKVKQLPCHDNKAELLINSDWFINPVSLSDYRSRYLQYVAERGQKLSSGNVRSHIVKAVKNFENFDCITIHAVTDLLEYSDSHLRQMLLKIEDHEWLEVIGGTEKAPVFSKKKVIDAVQLERKLYHQSCTYPQAALMLGMSMATLKTYLDSPDRSAKYRDLQPLIEMPISKKRRVSKQKIEHHIAMDSARELRKQIDADRRSKKVAIK